MLKKLEELSLGIRPRYVQESLNVLKALKKSHVDSLQALVLIGPKSLDRQTFENMKESLKEAIENIDNDINELMA